MDMGVGLLLLFCCSVYGHTSNREKRLILHSSDDIFQEIQSIRQEIQTLKTDNQNEIQKLKTDNQNEIQALKTDNANLKASLNRLSNESGSIYTRWGRTTCDGNGTEKVYSGYTAGQPYDIAGGAASALCLPDTPTWAKFVDGIDNIGGKIAGTEYEIYINLFNPFPQPMHDQDAPCAVCRSPRTTTIMIPGKTDCFPGWTMEYTGYLMSGHYTYKAAADYTCVDVNPAAVFHGEADQNGKLLYFTEVTCGSLPCQEYPNGRELACAVCSK